MGDKGTALSLLRRALCVQSATTLAGEVTLWYKTPAHGKDEASRKATCPRASRGKEEWLDG
jgi:hypothetical protein